VEDKLEFVAAGDAVAVVPAGAAATYCRPDLTTIPLEGVEPGHVVLATRADDHSRLVTAFRAAAQAHLTGVAQSVPESQPPV
jgi:DNA-binding transcriptional LysR family regulator